MAQNSTAGVAHIPRCHFWCMFASHSRLKQNKHKLCGVPLPLNPKEVPRYLRKHTPNSRRKPKKNTSSSLLRAGPLSFQALTQNRSLSFPQRGDNQMLQLFLRNGPGTIVALLLRREEGVLHVPCRLTMPEMATEPDAKKVNDDHWLVWDAT